MARQWLRLFAGATLTLSVAGHALAEEGKITVFAAASLTNAMQDIAKAYKKEKTSMWSPRLPLHQRWHGKSKRARLRTCLSLPTRNGWITRSRKAIDTASRSTLLGNSPVVVAPKASAQGDIAINNKTDWTSLLKGGRLAVGDPEHVPAGSTRKKRCKTGAWETLAPKLAPAEDVRGALALVERNEARWVSSTVPMRWRAKV